jgi:type-F conjugative transfer system pilin assembly protein TrbC
MKRILLSTSIALALFSNSAFAEISQQDLDKIKVQNAEAMSKALSSYKQSKPSNLNLGNIPAPQAKLTGSFSQKAVEYSAAINKIDPMATPKSKAKLFISLSMPIASIESYIKEADKLGRENISLSIIGFKKGATMRQTAAYLGSLTKGYNVSVEIDPPSFERFNIQTVPSLVIYFDDPLFEAKCAVGHQPDKMSALEKWEGTVGDVSIGYSIDALLDNPDSKFKGYLESLSSRLKGNYL